MLKSVSNNALTWLAAMLIALTTACSSTPDGIIPPKKMAHLLADMHEGEGVVETERSTYVTDSMKMLLRESIYRANGVTRQQVDSSMMWYGVHIEKYMEVYEDVVKILEKRLEKANSLAANSGSGDASATVSLEGDSIDVWTAPKHRRFSNNSGGYLILSRFNKDINWVDGDDYTLNIKLLNPRAPVGALIIAEYADGSFDYSTQQLNGVGWKNLSLKLDEKKQASSVAVAIDYYPAKDEVMYVDSISFVRKHPKTQQPIRNFDESTGVSPQDTIKSR